MKKIVLSAVLLLASFSVFAGLGPCDKESARGMWTMQDGDQVKKVFIGAERFVMWSYKDVDLKVIDTIVNGTARTTNNCAVVLEVPKKGFDKKKHEEGEEHEVKSEELTIMLAMIHPETYVANFGVFKDGVIIRRWDDQ